MHSRYKRCILYLSKQLSHTSKRQHVFHETIDRSIDRFSYYEMLYSEFPNDVWLFTSWKGRTIAR